jgi:hypothetical protein
MLAKRLIRIANRHEKLLVFTWTVCVVGLSLVPYVVGMSHSTQDMVFTGHLDTYPGDYSFHLGWAKQAYEGRVLLEFQLYGDRTETRLVVNAVFLLIGWLGRLLDISLPLAFQIVRIVVSVLLLNVVYYFASFFFSDRKWRWVALVLISFSSGLSWIGMLGLPNYWETDLSRAPRDADVIEISTFWHMRWEVITTPTVLLLVTTFFLAMKAYERDSQVSSCAAAVPALLLGLVHPHNLFTVYTTLFVYTVVRYGPGYLCGKAGTIPIKPWRTLLTILAFSVPTLAYYVYILNHEPVLWSYVHQEFPFEPFPLFMGYGVCGFAAVLGVGIVLVRKQRDFLFPLIWLTCALVLLYTPFTPAGGVFALDGLHIAVCLLGTKGLMHASQAIKRRLVALGCHLGIQRLVLRTMGLILFCMACLTNVLAVVNEVTLATGSSKPPFMNKYLRQTIQNYRDGIGVRNINNEGSNISGSPYFLPRDLRDAFAWLDSHSDLSDVILAPPYLSAFIPYLCGNRVHYHPGVPMLAANLGANYFETNDFYYAPLTAQERGNFLINRGIDYVLWWDGTMWDRREWKSSYEELQQQLPLETVFENGQAVIFKVTPQKWRPSPMSGSY